MPESVLNGLEELVRSHLPTLPLDNTSLNKALPALAKDSKRLAALHRSLSKIPLRHRLFARDARSLKEIPARSVHLVVTSPPYWTLKKYNESDGQLGDIEDFDEFLDELDEVWRECYRLLVPGARLVIVVGDVCLSRRKHGRHSVVPLHAAIQDRCRKIGFDNLAPIVWYKIANASLEVENGSRFLGKPYEPNAVIKNDVEYILMQRKSGGYRSPSPAMRVLSVIPEKDHRQWFQQIWTVPGAHSRVHPAPYPLQLAERLIRMFSFVGDTVLDPFLGTGTTCLAAARWGRNSVGYDVDPDYLASAANRLQKETKSPSSRAAIEIHGPQVRSSLPGAHS